jgi:hypothetical protein
VKPSWCAEARGAFDERSERERDQQRLYAPVRGQPRDRSFDDLELARGHGQVVEEDRVEDDPADRKESVGGAIDRCRGSGPGGHAVDDDGDEKR